MEAAKSLGAKYAVLTARHEDGFCLWPTKTTEYCVRNSPWKNGRGDVVKEFVEACRRHGIKPDSISPRTTTDTKYSSPRTGRSSGGKCGTVSRICAGRIRHSSKNTANWKWTRSPNC
ncbi:MAG: alpha-L-fucosidase [Alistipes indistinctus]